MLLVGRDGQIHVREPRSSRSPNSPFIVHDGLSTATPLGSGGLSMNFTVPMGLEGTSVLIQGVTIAGDSHNGTYASTNGGELQIIP